VEKDRSQDLERLIEVSELHCIEVAQDEKTICLRVRDRDGRAASVRLPVGCLNAVANAIPRPERELINQSSPHEVGSWSLAACPTGLILSLNLPNAAKITFSIQPWQLAAMASLAPRLNTRTTARLQ
jgi:hypothetical protein